MVPTTFWSANQPDAERAFRAWQSENRDGFCINERTKSSGMLHRVGCFHVGAPGNNDRHVTGSPKIATSFE